MNSRILQTADAAARLFIRQGYAGTQMSHIARAVGVSVGTLYLDFAGKKEILHFIFKCAVEPSFAGKALPRPITDDLFVGLEDELLALLRRSADGFEAHLSGEPGSYSFGMLLSDAFDMLSRYAVFCLLIEKNRHDFEPLTGYYIEHRARFQGAMERYLHAFIAEGTVRPLEQPELTATLIIETLSWWAMDIRYASFETRDIPIPLAKQVCMDNLLSAYGQSL